MISEISIDLFETFYSSCQTCRVSSIKNECGVLLVRVYHFYFVDLHTQIHTHLDSSMYQSEWMWCECVPIVLFSVYTNSYNCALKIIRGIWGGKHSGVRWNQLKWTEEKEEEKMQN